MVGQREYLILLCEDKSPSGDVIQPICLCPAGPLMLPGPGMLLCGIRLYQEQDCNT